MAKKNAFKFSYTLLLPIFVTNLVVGSHYSTYIEYGLEDEKICYPVGPQKKNLPRLGDNEKSAVLVRARHIFDYWLYDWLSDRTCRFVIKASKGDGLCAVIQKMSFRRKGDECLDYVQFAWSNGTRTSKICGYIDRNRTILDLHFESPETRHSSNESFDVLDHRGQLETYIFISKEKPSLGRSMDFSIVYTQFKDCKRADPDVYKSLKTPEYRDVCIRREYFCDGYQNCPVHLCQDELDCDNNIRKFISDGTGTKVTIGAVTTIILCFIIFVLCLYICKKHNKLCWSPDCAGRRPTVLVHTFASSGSGVPIPSAPMLEVAMPLSTVDKDLPPSYDSLFPEQSNRTTS